MHLPVGCRAATSSIHILAAAGSNLSSIYKIVRNSRIKINRKLRVSRVISGDSAEMSTQVPHALKEYKTTRHGNTDIEDVDQFMNGGFDSE